LKTLNGVRFFSMLYVVLGHAYVNMIQLPTSNTTYINEFVKPLWFQIILGGVFAVDVFFYLSGFLGVYLMITKFQGKRMINFGLIYFHRFYRLVPNILLLTFFFMTFFQYFGSGPIWEIYHGLMTTDCSKNWWTNVLFINTMYPGTNSCMGWLWYLSCDMVYFIILPFQVVAYLNSRLAGYLTVFLILLVNIIVVISLTIKHDISSSLLVGTGNSEYIYFKPWARAGAYQIGVLVGMLYYEYTKGNKPEGDRSKIGYRLFMLVNLSKAVRYACYFLGFVTIIY
jgi:peptidoglycan/LPS O-acetylase OafA/YrhL